MQCNASSGIKLKRKVWGTLAIAYEPRKSFYAGVGDNSEWSLPENAHTPRVEDILYRVAKNSSKW